ncbi:MAG: ScyD/ScyE family protein [Allobranchiibius sp.]
MAVPAKGIPGGANPSNGKPAYPVIAKGLDNPRQLAFAGNGDLYVAESGHGGNGPCIPSPDTPGLDSCFGTSGAITKITRGRTRQVITGLPSLAPQVAAQGGQLPPGAQAAGPSDVTMMGRNHVAFTTGFGSNPRNRSTFSAYSSAGHLLGTVATSRVSPWWSPFLRTGIGGVQQRADIAAFEAVNNPVPPADAPDSNANALITDGKGFVVVDAGANDLLRVAPGGKTSLIATFPSATKTCPPSPQAPQSVPTSVVKGPDHAYYVSELTGFPFCQGGSRIWKVKDGKTSVYASGLTNVTDLAFGSRGELYAVELAQRGLLNGPIGALVKIPRGGGDRHDVVAAGLFAPYGIALRGNSAYVTTGSILPAAAGGGQVIKIALPHGRR